MKNFIEKNQRQKELYLSKETIYNIIEDLKKEIKRHKDDFSRIQEIDQKYYDQILNLNIIIDILNNCKEKEISSKKEKKVIVARYSGNPYITVNLFCHALTQKKAIALVTENEMHASNKILVELLKNVLERYRIFNLVENIDNKKLEELENIQDLVNEVVCIGNSNIFYDCRKNKINNLKYIPFKNMAIFRQESKYIELENKLYEFCMINGIDSEIYTDIDINEFIDCMNIEETIENVVIFTHDLEKAKKVKGGIKNKKIFINENPFKNEKFYIEKL